MTAAGSRIERVNYRRGHKETSTLELEADNMSVRSATDGTLVVELFRYGARGQPLEGLQFHFAPDDRARLIREAAR